MSQRSASRRGPVLYDLDFPGIIVRHDGEGQIRRPVVRSQLRKTSNDLRALLERRSQQARFALRSRLIEENWNRTS